MTMFWESIHSAGCRVLWMSLHASICLALILLIHQMLGKRLSARWRYMLWSVLLLRMLLPWGIDVPLFDRSSPGVVPASASVADGRLAAEPRIALSQHEEMIGGVSASGMSDSTDRWTLVPHALGAIWIAGVCCVLACMVFQSRRLSGHVLGDRQPPPLWAEELLTSVGRKMGISAWPRLVLTSEVGMPALLGAIRPRVLLPESVLPGASETDPHPREVGRLRHVLLHEMAHIKHGDIWLNWLWALAISVHWFNPLLWWAGRRIVGDREIACDERVLGALPFDERSAYGHTLLDMARAVDGMEPAFVGAGLAGIVEHQTLLHRRITMIADYRPQSSRSMLLGCIALTLLICVASIRAGEAPRTDSESPANQEPFFASQYNYTHVTIFEPVGKFRPQTPMEMLNVLNRTLQPSGISTGYFRTKVKGDMLVGSICSANPDGLRKVLDKIPELKWKETIRLTKPIFEAHQARKQESMPGARKRGASYSYDSLKASGFVHLTTFEPVGKFRPQTPKELLNVLNRTLRPTGIATGFFRTKPQGELLIGTIITNDPDGLHKVLDKIPELKWKKTTRLTKSTFETYDARKQESMPGAGKQGATGGYAVKPYGYTHLTTFEPVGKFRPQTPIELLNALNETLRPARISTGYFRTKPEGDLLIGTILTDDPDGLRKVLDQTPELKWKSTTRLTKPMFETHEARKQESMPLADKQGASR